MSEPLYRPSRLRLLAISGALMAFVAMLFATLVSFIYYVIVPLFESIKRDRDAADKSAPNPVIVRPVGALPWLPGAVPPVNVVDLPTPPAIYPPVAGRVDVGLPAVPKSVALGGSGRYVVLHFPTLQTVGVFDVCLAKFARYLPAPDTDTLVAAGADVAVLYVPTRGVFEKWSLASGRLVESIASDRGFDLDRIRMGASSDGPLVSVSKKLPNPRAIRIDDLKNMDSLAAGPIADAFCNIRTNVMPHVAVSGDGRTVTRTDLIGGAGHRVQRLQIQQNGLPTIASGSQVLRYFTPSFDGGIGFGDGVFDVNIRRVGREPEFDLVYLPAAHDGYYLRVKPAAGIGAEVTIFPPEMLPNLGRLNGIPAGSLTGGETIPITDRVHLIPRANTLLVVQPSAKTISLFPVDLEKLREMANLDPLPFDIARMPRAEPGLRYRAELPDVDSVELIRHPEGMTINDDDEIEWEVPAGKGGGKVEVLLRLETEGGRSRLVGVPIELAGPKTPEIEPIAAMPRARP